jgi:hypothetical protein
MGTNIYCSAQCPIISVNANPYRGYCVPAHSSRTTRALPTCSCSAPIIKTSMMESIVKTTAQAQRKPPLLTFSAVLGRLKSLPLASRPFNFNGIRSPTHTSLRRSSRRLCNTCASESRSASKSTGFSKYAAAPRSRQKSFAFAPPSPLITKTGINCVALNDVKAIATTHAAPPVGNSSMRYLTMSCSSHCRRHRPR